MTNRFPFLSYAAAILGAVGLGSLTAPAMLSAQSSSESGAGELDGRSTPQGVRADPTQGDGLDDLFDALRQADEVAAEQIVGRIREEWSKSGSPAMDLLLRRGRDAMEAGDFARAVDHFNALIDHAPDFAEGYNGRATAFYRQDLYGLALADLRMALALNPRHFEAMTGLALMLEEIGLEEEALRAWHEVLALTPADPAALRAEERLGRAVDGTTL